jgi:hypothetical protein
LADVGKNRRPPAGKPASNPTRYPKGKQPAGRREMPRRSASQQARLWLVSLCGAVPGAITVYLTNSFWAGAGVFLAVVVVLGLILYLYEKRKQQ